jgi:hypothetical protein
LASVSGTTRAIALLLALVTASAFAASCSGNKTPSEVPPSPTARRFPGLTRPTPTSEASPISLMDLESRFLPEPLKSLIRMQHWYPEDTLENQQMLSAIVRASRGEVFANRSYHTEVADLLSEAERQTWYADGLDNSEKLYIRVLFDSFSLLSSRGDTSEITAMFTTAMKNPAFIATPAFEFDTRELTTIGFGENSDEIATGLGLIDSLVPVLDSYFGLRDMSYITFVISDMELSCRAFSPFHILLLHPACLGRTTMLHELTHLYMETSYPTWFTEGVAIFLSFQLTNTIAERSEPISAYFQEKGASPQFHRELFADPISTRELYIDEQRAGFLFLYEAFKILGEDPMRNALREIRKTTEPTFPPRSPAGPGERIFAILLANAPEDRRAELQRLIDSVVIR